MADIEVVSTSGKPGLSLAQGDAYIKKMHSLALSKSIGIQSNIANTLQQQPLHRFQFAELNIIHRGNSERTLNMVRRAIKMGYDSVVINIDIGLFGSIDEPKPDLGKHKKKKRAKSDLPSTPIADSIPDPFLVDPSNLDLSSLEIAGKKFRQFSRLTATVDGNSIHKLQHHSKLKLFDILALRILDEQLLLTLQRKGDFVDLITLDLSDTYFPWLWKSKLIQSCIDAGISFELCYAKVLSSSEHRRQFFANARQLMEVSRRGKGIVLSSGAEDLLGLRGPFDAANLCVLFGLSSKDGRKFVSANAKHVLLRCQSRKTLKMAIHVTKLNSASDIDKIPTASGTSSGVFQRLSNIDEFKLELNLLQQKHLPDLTSDQKMEIDGT